MSEKLNRARRNKKGVHMKKKYITPEITRIKMQPEQAVLSCCLVTYDSKILHHMGRNHCEADTAFCFRWWDSCEDVNARIDTIQQYSMQS